MRNLFVHVLSVALLGVAAAPLVAGAEDAGVPGHVTVARFAPAALVLWDASTVVGDAVRAKESPELGRDHLERDALRVLAARVATFPHAETIAVRVLYQKNGAVSPVYGTPTFLGIERYATLTMSAADARSDRDGWREAASGTKPLPAWIGFAVTGELPPN